MTASIPVIDVTKLNKSFSGKQIINDLSLRINKGEIFGFLGPNGSGKTSLLRILCGLSAAAAGEVRWNQARAQGEPFHRDLLYISHHAAVKEELSALENLLIASTFAATPLTKNQALEALARMGLEGREHLPTKVLSQGQKRRVGLARLLVSNAPLWILDEPLTALDARAVELIQARLAEHLARQGMVVLTTHQALQVPGFTPRRIELN